MGRQMFLNGAKALCYHMAFDVVLAGETGDGTMLVLIVEGFFCQSPGSFRGKSARDVGAGKEGLSSRAGKQG